MLAYVSRAMGLALLIWSLTALSGFAQMPESGLVGEAASSKIRVAIYDHSSGTASGPKALRRCLTEEAGFECVRVTPEDVQGDALSRFDVLIMPGGSGSAQARKLGDDGRDRVRRFVRDGGGYVGICAGSYLASSHYEWSLHLLNAQVHDRAHWARGTGQVTLTMTPAGQIALGESDEEIDVYYGQGPLLVPDTKPDLPAFEPLAKYATEIAKNGAPSGVMIGTTAIARAQFGRGRVICYSPHPEVSGGPNHLIVAGIEWAAGEVSEPVEMNP
jgi:glutamine amidotransferase-like uncharacterized protein